MAEKSAYSVKELAESGPIGRTKLYEAIKVGDLVARKYGASTIVLREDWESFLRRLPKAERVAA